MYQGVRWKSNLSDLHNHIVIQSKNHFLSILQCRRMQCMYTCITTHNTWCCTLDCSLIQFHPNVFCTRVLSDVLWLSARTRWCKELNFQHIVPCRPSKSIANVYSVMLQSNTTSNSDLSYQDWSMVNLRNRTSVWDKDMWNYPVGTT